MTNLDSGEVYYLSARIPIPDNTQSVGLAVVRWDVSKQKLHGPIILAAVNKELISSNIEEGGYVIKNSQGKIESWDPPNKN